MQMYRKNIFDMASLTGKVGDHTTWTLERGDDSHVLRIEGEAPTNLYHDKCLVGSNLFEYELLKGRDYELRDDQGMVFSILGTRVTHRGAESVKWRK